MLLLGADQPRLLGEERKSLCKFTLSLHTSTTQIAVGSEVLKPRRSPLLAQDEPIESKNTFCVKRVPQEEKEGERGKGMHLQQ